VNKKFGGESSIMEAILILAGLLSGIAVGATAIGSGLLTVPLLMLLGVRPTEIVGTALATNFLTRLVAACQHNRQGTIHYRLVTFLALGSLPTSVLTIALMSAVKTSLEEEVLDLVIVKFIGAMLLFVSGAGLVSEFLAYRKNFGKFTPLKVSALEDEGREMRDGELNGKGKVVALFVGILTGVLVTSTGIGTGGIVVASLNTFTNLEPTRIVGTAIVHGVLLTIVSLLGHVWVGEFNLLNALLFCVGSIPGALIGSRISVLVPKRALKLTLLTLVLLSGAKALV